MIKFPHFSISKIFLAVFFGLIFTGLVLHFFNQKIEIEIVDDTTRIEDFLEEAQTLWKNPSFRVIFSEFRSGKPICSDIPISYSSDLDDFLICNPNLISCWIKGELGGQYKNFKPKGDLKIHPDRSVSFEFKDLIQQESYQLKLEYNCHKKFIQPRVFSATASRDKGELWDNFNRSISVDKFYVSNYEVALGSGTLPIISQESLKPHLMRRLEEMKNMCKSFGGKLLPNHVFEALAYFPAKVEKNYQFKSHVPWDKTLKLQILKAHTKVLCKNVLTSECDDNNYHNYIRQSPSWGGVFHMLGSEIEVFDNYFEPEKNIKISSRYLPYYDETHENSYRNYWNGVWGNQMILNHEKIKELIEDKVIKGFAFRCIYN